MGLDLRLEFYSKFQVALFSEKKVLFPTEAYIYQVLGIKTPIFLETKCRVARIDSGDHEDTVTASSEPAVSQH